MGECDTFEGSLPINGNDGQVRGRDDRVIYRRKTWAEVVNTASSAEMTEKEKPKTIP